MAELVAGALLGSSFQVIFEKLASVDIRDYFYSNNVDDLVKKLHNALDSINQVLDEAEIKQYKFPHVKKWLNDLKHVVYEADQLLDEISTDAMLNKLKDESEPVTTNLLGWVPSFTTNPFVSRIKEQLETLKSLAEQKKELGLGEGPCASNEGLVSSKPSKILPSTALVDESRTYGRDDDKEKLIKSLLEGNESGNHVPIISIVGLGGMGKTTLAQLVYNDPTTKEHFQLKAWVYVSESFDLAGLTKAILESFGFSANGDLNQLQLKLQEKLMGKKYLLVLDDIWNAKGECWEKLLLPFNHGSSGSKIMVTTREKEVADYVLNSTKSFDLPQLDKIDCWRLFETHAFHGKSVCDNPQLESIGRKIVDKCGGLPLAIKSLGQILRKFFSEREWTKILETDMWRLSDVDHNINSVLRLSYHNLCSDLKRCFSYCSIFPKGYKFKKDELIKLWMAEGLLECCGNKSEEEFGNEIFGYLESISFFQQSYWNDYAMHDLVNDLAKSVSGEFCMQIEGARVKGSLERTRHIRFSLRSNCVDKLLELTCELQGLRSLILDSDDNETTLISNNVQHDLFSSLKCLRMLSFRYCGLSELVAEISNLKLLRYLDLSYTELTSLPDTICMLYNLQTLLLRGCSKLTELPSNLSKLVNLRHLELPSDFRGVGINLSKLVNLRHLEQPCIKKMPKHMGKLNNLQTLSYFIVEEQNGSDLKELAKLNHLHGTIEIEGLGNVTDLADAAPVNLKDKKYLEELYMKFDGGRKEMDESMAESNVSVLEALQPNSNLKRLTISQYKGNSFPDWIRGCLLPNLVYLELKGCGLCSHLPPLGQLPCLKKLYIRDCDGIKIIGEEFHGKNSTNVPFLSLQVLVFVKMNNWEEWLCLEGFPLLKELEIIECPKLKRVSLLQHLPSLQKLKINDCNKLEASIPKGDSIIELDLQGCGLCFDLPPLGQLPCLKELSIRDCAGIKIIGEEFHGNNSTNVPFLSLEVLKFEKMNNWEDWFCLEGFPLLKELKIIECPKLKRVSLLQHLPSLQKLKINDCKKLEASIPKGDSIIELDLQRCERILVNELPTSLKKFVLRENQYTEFSVEQILVNNTILEELELDLSGSLKCPSLDLCCYNSLRRLSLTGWRSSSLPFSLHLFTNLRDLWLDDCLELDSFPEGGLPSDLSLSISNCPKLIGSREEWGLFQLNSLKCFSVSDHEFENVESFPEENLLPPTLKSLYLNNCSKLRKMNNKGFLHLKSLDTLIIINCPSLERLPEKEDLPNSLSNLWIENCHSLELLTEKEGLPNSLSFLNIKDCPLIKEKYQKEGGERWHTICHIPNVRIW